MHPPDPLDHVGAGRLPTDAVHALYRPHRDWELRLEHIALIGAGAVLGDRSERVGDVVALLQVAVVLAIVAILGVVVWRRFVQPRLRADD